MAEEFDVEAMLEAPFRGKETTIINGTDKERDRSERNNKERKRRRSKSRSRSKEKERKGNRSKERRRSRDRERKSKSKERHRRSRSRDRRSKSKERTKNDERSPHKEKDRDKDKDKERKRRSKSREREKGRNRRSPPRWDRWGNGRRYGRSRSRSPLKDDLPPEERDQRTVFCMQLAARIRVRDLEEFFSAVGKVREVRLIMDNKTRRHKGIAYIEFLEIASVPLALALSGQKLCGVPIVIQPTQAEKNRAAASASAVQRGFTGPMRLYVGSLHFNITEEMLKGIFEPFGRIDKIELMRDTETGRSKGYGFITFHDAEDAKKALEQLNGFELAGRPMKVNHVTERTEITQGPSLLDSDELERTGIDLGTTGRLQLMAKLAEGTGIQMPQAALTALQMNTAVNVNPMIAAPTPVSAPPIATQCFVLANMFDSTNESNTDWADEIRNDVIEECRKHGGALHVYVDVASSGNVYVKCPTIAASTAAVSALHGRWFAGRLVTAAYVTIMHYHQLFPDSISVTLTL